MARPTDCTPELTERVCEALKKGAYAVDAAASVGIDASTFYNWMRRGKKGEPVYVEFFHAVKLAKSVRVQVLCEAIAAEPAWQARAWLLERTDPKRFGRNDRVKLDAKVEAVGGFKDAKSAALAMERMLAALKGMAEDEEEG
jgi:transposase